MQKTSKIGLMSGIILIAIGLVLTVFTSQFSELFSILIAFAVLIFGAYRLIKGFLGWNKSASEGSKYGNKIWITITGIFLVCSGICMLIFPSLIEAVLGIFAGIMAFIAGIDRLATAKAIAMTNGTESFTITPTHISGIIHILFGIVMCFAPLYGLYVLVTILGIYLVTAGVLVLLSVLKWNRSDDNDSGQ